MAPSFKEAMGHLSGTTVAILAGGLGTRIRPILGQVPKLLAPVAGKPFLDYLLAWLTPHEPDTILLCLGHGAAIIVNHVENHSLGVQTVVEPTPLGTAGGLRFALANRPVTPLLVLNGDTFLDGDLSHFFHAHKLAGRQGSLLCVTVEDGRRYGTLTLDEQDRIHQFVEKDANHQGAGCISSGILLLEPPLVRQLLAGEGPSLERDFLARLSPGSLQGVKVDWPFIDFGVPDSYHHAQTFFAHLTSLQKEIPG